MTMGEISRPKNRRRRCLSFVGLSWLVLGPYATFSHAFPLEKHHGRQANACFPRSEWARDRSSRIDLWMSSKPSPPTSQLEKQSTETARISTEFAQENLPPPSNAQLFILFLSQFLLFIGVGAVIPSIPLLGKDLGLSGVANGAVLSAPAVALLASARLAGQISDDQGRKAAMMSGMGIIALSDWGTAVAPSWASLILARMGLGLGRSISEAGERGLLADWANRQQDQRGKLLAAQQVTVAVGVACGAPLGGLVVEAAGTPRAAFYCVTVAAGVALALYSLLEETVPLRQDDGAEESREEVEEETNWIEGLFLTPFETINSFYQARKNNDESGTDTSSMQKEDDWIQLWKQNVWKGLALCQCGATFGFAAKISSIPLLATTLLPGGAVGAGWLVSACGLCGGLVGAPLGGWATDVSQDAAKTAILAGLWSGLCLCSIPILLLPEANTFLIEHGLSLSHFASGLEGSPLAFAVAVLGWSAGAAAQGPALTAVAQEVAPKGKEATALAIPRAAGDATYIAAPILLGWVSDQTARTGASMYEYVGDAGGFSGGWDCGLAGVTTWTGVVTLALLLSKQKTESV